jgi:N6-L-threonylcarbamoyladenine synthase
VYSKSPNKNNQNQFTNGSAPLKILAFESSCDETAAAVVEDGRRVLSGVVASQVATHRLYGGVVPEIASRQHTEAIAVLCREALVKAGIGFDDIDALAVTYAPGLIGALLVGVNFAKGLSMSLGLPLIPVHHLRSHIAANYIASPELEPPFLCLVASGGHSHIVVAKDYTHFDVLGRTRDDAAGEAFDKAARALGFPYPGGAFIDSAAKLGNPKAVKLPRPQVDGAPYDFSFSGLKTAGGEPCPQLRPARQGTQRKRRRGLVRAGCGGYARVAADARGGAHGREDRRRGGRSVG